MNIIPISGYSPNFSWQVGFNSQNAKNNSQQFRATIRPLNGLEQFTRVPNNVILYEESGIVVNNVTNQGQWSFPLDVNASISGGPYRDYQVVIEAYDFNGNTSAGNSVGGTINEQGWVAYPQGYDIIAITNPRQTGIEMSNNLPTQYTINTGIGNTGFTLNSGNGYSTLNYMGSHGEINIRYLSGIFDSNIVGGYIYVWTGQFPKYEALLGISGYDSIYKSQFTNFDPNLGYIYHPTAAMPFRGSNYVYVSLSFYDNLDQEAIDNGIDISTGLYLSDNSICYNDIAAGSISIGGLNTLYAIQYSGSSNPTGVIGTGVFIVYSGQYNNITSLLYMSRPMSINGLPSYSGVIKTSPGGAGGNAILINNNPINPLVSFNLKLQYPVDDTCSLFINNTPIRDTSDIDDPTTTFDILSLSISNNINIQINDILNIKTKDNNTVSYSTSAWSGDLYYKNGIHRIVTGGINFTGSSGPIPSYYDNGSIKV